jgi:DNA polymerase-1
LVEREQIINRMMLRRSARGVVVDPYFLDQYAKRTEQDRQAHLATLRRTGWDKAPTPSQLVARLESLAALPDDHPRTATGKPSTAADHLEKLDHPLARAYVAEKQIRHVQDDYLRKCLDLAIPGSDGLLRAHPEVGLLKATTGRMAVGNPPFQQFPGDARGVVLADPGDQLTSIDWAQIEPVIAANIAHDTEVLDEYESGKDLYEVIEGWAAVPRKRAKVIMLATLYGQGLTALADSLGTDTDEASALQRRIFEHMPKIEKLIWRIRDTARAHRCVFTLSGRILPIPKGRGGVGVQVHKAMNYLIQGSAYDLLAEALVRIEQAELGDAVYLAMHDEIVCSTSIADEVERIMQTPPPRLIELAGRTPVLRTDSADLGERWAQT